MPDVSPATKPGWQTTEFWKYAAVIVIGALAMFGVISADDKSSLEAKALDVVERVSGLIVAFLAARQYGKDRKEVKVAAIEAQAPAAVVVEPVKVEGASIRAGKPGWANEGTS